MFYYVYLFESLFCFISLRSSFYQGELLVLYAEPDIALKNLNPSATGEHVRQHFGGRSKFNLHLRLQLSKLPVSPEERHTRQV